MKKIILFFAGLMSFCSAYGQDFKINGNAAVLGDIRIEPVTAVTDSQANSFRLVLPVVFDVSGTTDTVMYELQGKITNNAKANSYLAFMVDSGEVIKLKPDSVVDYSADVSANYTSRSLVDSAFVGQVVAAGGDGNGIFSASNDGGTVSGSFNFNLTDSIGLGTAQYIEGAIPAGAIGGQQFKGTHGVISLSGNGQALRFRSTGSGGIKFEENNSTKTNDLLIKNEHFDFRTDNWQIRAHTNNDTGVVFKGGGNNRLGINTGDKIDYTLDVGGTAGFTDDIYLANSDYNITDRGGFAFALEQATSGSSAIYELFTKDGDGTDNISFQMWAEGTTADVSNGSFFRMVYESGDGQFVIKTGQLGTGTAYPIVLETNGNGDQMRLETNGDVAVDGYGDYVVQGSDPATEANRASIYAKDVSSSAEIFVQDEAGNTTQLSNHDSTGKAHYLSYNVNTGKVVHVKLEEMYKAMDEFLGGGYYTEYIDSSVITRDTTYAIRVDSVRVDTIRKKINKLPKIMR